MDEQALHEVFLAGIQETFRLQGQELKDIPYEFLAPLRRHLSVTGLTCIEPDLHNPDRCLMYARSIARDGLWQLTEFFGRPEVHGRGLGARLLAEVQANRDPAATAVILASGHPHAMALYMKAGVYARTPMYQFTGPPLPATGTLPEGLEACPAGPADVSELDAVDTAVLGFTRSADHRFLLEHGRPCLLLRRGSRPAGYGYLAGVAGCGPGAVVDPADMPALLQVLRAEPRGVVSVMLSGDSAGAIRELLAQGFRLRPYSSVLMSNRPLAVADRYLFWQPIFVL